MLKIDQAFSAEKNNIFGTFFQTAAILRQIGIVTYNQSQMKPTIPNIHNMKDAYEISLTTFEIFCLKIGLIL